MEQSESVSLRDQILGRPIGLDYYDEARKAYFGGDFDSAELSNLIADLASEPVRLSTARAMLGDRPGAIDALAGATDVNAIALHGRLLLEEGRWAQAIQVLEPGLGDDRDNVVGAMLAEACIMTGDLERGRELAGRGEYGADDGRGEYLDGLLLEKEGEYRDALAKYESAVERDPNCTMYYFRLGYLHALHGDENRSITAYEKCREQVPVFARALINLGIAYEDIEEYDKAMQCYRQVLQAYPEHPRAKLYLADADASCDMYYDREKEKERNRRNQLLQIPITDFELSVRSRNCLQKMNIHTLGDLIKKTEAELLSYKNFGETSLSEIKRILAQKGFRLGQGLEEQRKQQRALPDSEQEKILSEPVSVLELSSRSQRCMDRLGIESLGDLCKRTELELVSQKNFGVTSLNEVKRKLKERSLSLASG